MIPVDEQGEQLRQAVRFVAECLSPAEYRMGTRYKSVIWHEGFCAVLARSKYAREVLMNGYSMGLVELDGDGRAIADETD